MKKDAALFILLGQSNAVGHAVPMKDEDIINNPLKNVFGLSREKNQSFDIQELSWDNYVSFGMNLAEEQDDTYSLANCLAKLWQAKIDGGADLPDLHIIQIAIGAQGTTEGYMWYPDYEKKLIPGKLGTVDIALFPFTKKILSLVDCSFKKLGKTYEIIGIHWRGSENDTSATMEYLKENSFGIHKTLFDGFRESLGECAPIIFHNAVSYDRSREFGEEHVAKKHFMNDEMIPTICRDLPNMSIFDIRTYPGYLPDVRGNGIYIEDVVHYKPEVNNWVAGVILKDYMG